MNQAINAYEKTTVSPEVRELERARSYARHNEASALRHAREQGMANGVKQGMKQERKEIVRNALAEGVSIELIKKITGLNEKTLNRIKAGQKE